MKLHKKIFNRNTIYSAASLAFLVAGMFLTSCNCCSFKIPIPPCLCFNGRRPQVMAHAEECVIDYNEGEEGAAETGCVIESEGSSLCDEGGCGGSDVEVTRITPEMLDPHLQSVESYRLSIGDHVEISVFGDEDTIAGQVVVAPDGKIYYTFLEGIPAAGRTIPDLSEEIASKIRHLFLNPIVTIIPLTSVNNVVKIFGRVQFPGVYKITSQMRLLDALGDAGGFATESFRDKDKDAELFSLTNLHASFVIRDKKKIRVDFERLFAGDESQNIYLKAEDYIYIAPNDHAEVYILGNVRSSRALSFTRGMTLMHVMTSAGGWNSGSPYASDINRVLVLRGNLECPCVAMIDLTLILQGKARDLYLQPGDIIFVPNKEMRFGRELVRVAVFNFIESFATGVASYYADMAFPNITNCGGTGATGTTGTTTPVTPIITP